jgi:hypothetical protein
MSVNDGIYALAAPHYLRRGWEGVLPIGAAGRVIYKRNVMREDGLIGQDPVLGTGKMPPPRGYTGSGGYPDAATIEQWRQGVEAGDNVALRLPWGVYGLDVDAHGEKPGLSSLEALKDKCGPLPATWSSTSRGQDSPARIYLFRAEPFEGCRWKDHPGEGLDSIHFGHRYMIVCPSIHPGSGMPYRWYRPDGTENRGAPRMEDLTELPRRWILEMTQEGIKRDGGYITQREMDEALSQFREGEPCKVVSDFLAWELERIKRTEQRGGSLRNAGYLFKLALLGVEGHVGVKQALMEHHEAYVDTRCRIRNESEESVSDNWHEMVRGALALKLGEVAQVEKECTCLAKIRAAKGMPNW